MSFRILHSWVVTGFLALKINPVCCSFCVHADFMLDFLKKLLASIAECINEASCCFQNSQSIKTFLSETLFWPDTRWEDGAISKWFLTWFWLEVGLYIYPCSFEFWPLWGMSWHMVVFILMVVAECLRWFGFFQVFCQVFGDKLQWFCGSET